MSGTALAVRLRLPNARRALLLNEPAAYRGLLGPLPEELILDTEPAGTYDFVQLFVRNKAELDEGAPRAFAAVKSGGLLWISYPKRTSGLETDIHRDRGWETVDRAGWRGVAQVSIDATWSALRFRPAADVGT